MVYLHEKIFLVKTSKYVTIIVFSAKKAFLDTSAT